MRLRTAFVVSVLLVPSRPSAPIRPRRSALGKSTPDPVRKLQLANATQAEVVCETARS